MPRHADPRLLRELKAEWSEYGCALCERTASLDAPMGFGVELHHVHPRSRGGGDYRYNILGLCGELSDCKAHWQVTAERAAIIVEGREPDEHPGDRRDWYLRWFDKKMGWEHLLRIGPCYEPERAPLELSPAESGFVDIQPSPYGDTDLITATPTGTPEERFSFIRGLYQDAENRRVACAVMLAWVENHGEHLELGYETIEEYAVEAGFSKADAVKMILAGRVFGDRWAELDAGSRSTLSLSRLYYGGRLVRDHDYSVDDALHAAIGNTTAGLVALIQGDEPAEMCECSKCGKRHWPMTAQARAIRG